VRGEGLATTIPRRSAPPARSRWFPQRAFVSAARRARRTVITTESAVRDGVGNVHCPTDNVVATRPIGRKRNCAPPFLDNRRPGLQIISVTRVVRPRTSAYYSAVIYETSECEIAFFSRKNPTITRVV